MREKQIKFAVRKVLCFKHWSTSILNPCRILISKQNKFLAPYWNGLKFQNRQLFLFCVLISNTPYKTEIETSCFDFWPILKGRIHPSNLQKNRPVILQDEIFVVGVNFIIHGVRKIYLRTKNKLCTTLLSWCSVANFYTLSGKPGLEQKKYLW